MWNGKLGTRHMHKAANGEIGKVHTCARRCHSARLHSRRGIRRLAWRARPNGCRDDLEGLRQTARTTRNGTAAIAPLASAVDRKDCATIGKTA